MRTADAKTTPANCRDLACIAEYYEAQFADLTDAGFSRRVLPLASLGSSLGAVSGRGRDRGDPNNLISCTKKTCAIKPRDHSARHRQRRFHRRDEINRSQVREFVGGLLRGLAIDSNAAVIIAVHPEASPASHRAARLSGSTQWPNKVGRKTTA